MSNIKKILFAVSISFFILFFCTNTIKAASFKPAKKEISLAVGNTYQIKYKNIPKKSTIKYSYSTDSKFVSISKKGLVKAKGQAKNHIGETAEIKIKAKVKNTAGKVKTYKFTLSVKIKAKNKFNADYSDAESFEEALNDGKNVVGKTVMFKIRLIYPDSAFGYNMVAGDHLNFCSPEFRNTKKGDVVCVKVDKVISFLGSYIIYYSDFRQ